MSAHPQLFDGDLPPSENRLPASATTDHYDQSHRPTGQQYYQQQQRQSISPRLDPQPEPITTRDRNSRRSRHRKKLGGASTISSSSSSSSFSFSTTAVAGTHAHQQFALDPVRKDTIVHAKEMLLQGRLERGEFLEILTGSFTKIAIDVAEDYNAACKSVGAKFDTEETVSSILHPRVLSLAQFVLSARSLDMHMQVDAQTLVIEYLDLCNYDSPVSFNSEKVLVPLLVHYCQHVFQNAGMDKLNWSPCSAAEGAPTLAAALLPGTDPPHRVDDLLALPEGTVEFEVQKVVGMTKQKLKKVIKDKHKNGASLRVEIHTIVSSFSWPRSLSLPQILTMLFLLLFSHSFFTFFSQEFSFTSFRFGPRKKVTIQAWSNQMVVRRPLFGRRRT
jgi:hypothetical protein